VLLSRSYHSHHSYPPYEPESPITQVFYDGEAIPQCDDSEAEDLDPCYQSIESDGEGTTTVVAQGSKNGGWGVG
jgi:hypothetical protein